MEIDVAEDPANIVDIEVLWEGYAAGCNQMELYVWDHVSSQWCDGAGNCGANAFMDNLAVNRDDVMRGHIRTDFDCTWSDRSLWTDRLLWPNS